MVCDLIQQILNPFKNLDRLRYRAVLLTEFLLPLEVYKGPYMPLRVHPRTIHQLVVVDQALNHISFMTFMPFFSLEHNTR